MLTSSRGDVGQATTRFYFLDSSSNLKTVRGPERAIDLAARSGLPLSIWLAAVGRLKR